MQKPLCLIVGSGEGLGQSLAFRFASEGFDLALLSRTGKNARATIASLERTFPDKSLRFYPADVTKPEETETLILKIQGLNLVQSKGLLGL